MKSSTRNVVLGLAASAAVVTLAACSSTATDSESSAPSTALATSATSNSSPPSSPAASIPGSFISLSDYEGNKAKYANSNVVFFFDASWCPTCKEAKQNFVDAAGQFPKNLTIVDVDYDSNTELRQKYGVTVQHTFVQVDSRGNMIKKWSGSTTPEQVESQLAT